MNTYSDFSYKCVLVKTTELTIQIKNVNNKIPSEEVVQQHI